MNIAKIFHSQRSGLRSTLTGSALKSVEFLARRGAGGTLRSPETTPELNIPLTNGADPRAPSLLYISSVRFTQVVNLDAYQVGEQVMNPALRLHLSPFRKATIWRSLSPPLEGLRDGLSAAE